MKFTTFLFVSQSVFSVVYALPPYQVKPSSVTTTPTTTISSTKTSGKASTTTTTTTTTSRNVPSNAIENLRSNIPAILQGLNNGAKGGVDAFVSIVKQIKPTSKPSSPKEVIQRLQDLNAAKPSNLPEYIAGLQSANLIDSIDSLAGYVNGKANGENSMSNNNPKPTPGIYPRKGSSDAPYSVSEAQLRAAIYIPPGFTYGKKPPVILFPGTGSTGFTAFKGNFIPLLQNTNWADPVWVNVPGFLLDDAQINAEYAAYAMNYIAAITKRDVTILGWSQGNIDIQWAFKYWPSTRRVTSDHVAVSADYAGTIIANFASLPGIPLPPSVLQQQYLASSNFITTLRRNGGDSGYVPTTTIYSGFFDEIVQPQTGTTASSFLLDARRVGVTNNEVQVVCPLQPAGTFYTHEGVLYNPVAFALLKDAMTNDGPGRISRLNLQFVCSTYLTPGLDVGDLLITENAIAIAGLAILAYEPKVTQEPAIKAYARNG